MKIYYPSKHYNKAHRGQLFPLLKAFIKNAGFTDAERVKMYGVSEKDYRFVDEVQKAQVVVLTMSWNYYAKTGQMQMAIDLIKKAAAANKTVWSYNSGDFGVKVPYFPNLKVFRFSGYLANKQKGHYGMPVMIKDYLKNNSALEKDWEKAYAQKPKVGFCGQADDSKLTAAKEIARTILRNSKTKLGLRLEEAQEIISTTKLRADLLKQLEEANSIDDNFIKRKKYRAGVVNNKTQHQTTKEFYDNILESDYVLCVRGGGNFSVRFYETLMMGRIPLYIHTDGFLPLADKINWKEHLVWIDYKDISKIEEKLLDFHQNLDEEKLQNLFMKNRKLWEEKLQLDGFFKSEFAQQ